MAYSMKLLPSSKRLGRERLSERASTFPPILLDPASDRAFFDRARNAYKRILLNIIEQYDSKKEIGEIIMRPKG